MNLISDSSSWYYIYHVSSFQDMTGLLIPLSMVYDCMLITRYEV